MNDRLKFRAIFNVPYTDENGEEKETKIVIPNVMVGRGLDVGFSDNELLESIEKLILSEEQKEEIKDFFDNNSNCIDDDYYFIYADVIAQCTGLKDKNGKLIYENDYLKIRNKTGTIFIRVRVDFYMGCFMVYDSDNIGNYLRILFDECWEIEIIGNTHENLDLLGEKQ
ncbi:MAG: YopX family protein [Alphaproteobacteria bacterium]|nr:YopX family protein [Alphaproteobacteria bacterium]